MRTRDVAVGMAMGAALAYVMDPNTGRRRRALARDQLVRATRKTRDALDATARDVSNRTAGVVAAARGRMRDRPIDDDRLVERVRSRLGRVSSHPRAIDVDASNGIVTLRGPILAAEVDDVLSAVRVVRGMRDVRNELDVHDSAEGVPSLQGRGNIAGSRLDIFQRSWAPATQALVAAAGVATAVCVATYSRR